MYETLGHSYMQLEYTIEAADCLSRALQIREARGERDTPAVMALAEQLVEVDYPTGRLRVSISRYQALLDAARARYGEADPSVQRLRVALARGRVQLGEWTHGRDELAAVLGELQVIPKSDPAFRLEVEKGLSLVDVELGHFNEAEHLLRKIIADVADLRGADHQEEAFAELLLARVMYQTDRLDEAEALIVQAESVDKKWSRDGGTLPLTINLYRASLRLKQGRAEDAIAILETNKRVARTDDQSFDQSFNENRPLALAYRQLHRMPEALATIRTALDSSRKTLGDHHPITLEIGSDLVQILSELGRVSEAKAEARRLLEGAPTTLADTEASRRRLFAFQQQQP